MTMLKRWLCAVLGAALLLISGASWAQEDYIARTQAVLEAFLRGDTEQIVTQFDENMAALVDAAALADAWTSVNALYGTVTGVAAAQEDKASYTAALLLAHEAGQTMLVVEYDETGRIAGLSITPKEQAAQTVERELPKGVAVQAVTLFAGTQHELAGELLIPANADPNTPYAVLVHGSGPSDMDETIGGCKPFRDLAYDLAALGVGSLRFDKTTYAQPEWPVETVKQEYLEPAAEALAVLRGSVETGPVVLIGHSQGGMLVPWLVEACGFDGGISLSGTPWQLWEISHAQNMALIELLPEEQREILTMQVEYEREKALRLLEMTDEEAAKTTVYGVSAVYQRYLAQMDQAQIAKASVKPFLFLWGERDFQVEREAFKAWHERLGDDERFSYKTYPGLNHLLMPAGESDSIANAAAAYQEPKVMDQKVTADIADWILSL